MIYYRRHLPHYQPLDAIFFVTFRLAGSLPAAVIEEMCVDRERTNVSRELIIGKHDRMNGTNLTLIISPGSTACSIKTKRACFSYANRALPALSKNPFTTVIKKNMI